MTDKIKKYSNASAFRTSLDERLKNIAKQEKTDIQRLQRQLAFDRLLARLFTEPTPQWALKGGYAMELRLNSARATKDIDMAMRDEKLLGSDPFEKNQKLQEIIQVKVSRDLGDFFTFIVKPATLDIDGAPYGGARFPIEARIDGRTFSRFSLDIGIGDIWLEPLEQLETRDWLGFAGVSNQTILAVSKEQQFAEKLHAYTLPRENNSRVKDLVDMALLIATESLNKEKLKAVIAATFKRRNTHAVPDELEAPPQAWVMPFAVLAKECEFAGDMNSAFMSTNVFLNAIQNGH